MTTATAEKKATRAHLIRAAKAGRLWVCCSYRYTDDYAYDNAVNCGKESGFSQVYLVPEYVSPYADEINQIYNDARAAGEPAQVTHTRVEPLMEKQRRGYQEFERQHAAKSAGMKQLRMSDFRTKSGWITGTTASGSFHVHSNLCYRYEIR